MPLNRQIHLISRPSAAPSLENFSLVSTPTSALADGDVLVRHHFLSLDPYMRGRMNDAKNYAQPQALNETMIGGTVQTCGCGSGGTAYQATIVTSTSQWNACTAIGSPP